MNNFHGVYKKTSFFEGWYLKHQSEQSIVAVIPAFHIDREGKKSTTIQVIINEHAYFFEYPVEEFRVSKKRFCVKIGNSLFCEKGIRLDVKNDEVSIKATFEYGKWIPMKRNIMGPFQYVPFMQCNHQVMSLSHDVSGKVIVNDKRVELLKGTGYTEKDWGSSFPDTYLWTQCSDFSQSKCCIMLSVASIPILGMSFTGCIGVIYYNDREYLFATYRGVKIIRWTEKEVLLQQGKYYLYIQLLQKSELSLKAPCSGEMVRTIKESPSCRIRYLFFEKKRVIFDVIGKQAGFEYANNTGT